MTRRLVWPLALAMCACSGDKKAAVEQKAAVESAAPAAPTPVDTAKSAPPPDTTAAAKKAPADSRLRDSAVAPRFEMGADGKVRPIRKP
jgi:hypothetical protein